MYIYIYICVCLPSHTAPADQELITTHTRPHQPTHSLTLSCSHSLTHSHTPLPTHSLTHPTLNNCLTHPPPRSPTPSGASRPRRGTGRYNFSNAKSLSNLQYKTTIEQTFKKFCQAKIEPYLDNTIAHDFFFNSFFKVMLT